MDSPKTLMVVGAHHDDNEGNAGGLIARHRKAGWRVVSVVMTNGRWGRGTISDENIDIRNRESIAAAKVLDMDPVFMAYPEDGFRATAEACDALVQRIVEHRPDVLVTHPPHDYHFDHMSTSQCVLDASYLCASALAQAGHALPRLYYCDAFYVPFEPDVYVEVGDFIDLKAQAQACHKSQIPPDDSGHSTIIELATTRARHRGIESGHRYAEAFRFVPKLAQSRMAELLD